MNLYRLTYTTATETPGPSLESLLSPYGVVVVDSAAPASEVLIDLTRQIDLPVVEHVLRGGGYRVLGLDRAQNREPAAV